MESNNNVDVKNYKFFKKLTELLVVKKILLYGSRAKGFHAERADIDLAIVCPRATNQDWNDILEIIENADTLLSIDCVRFDQIKSQKFKNAILDNHQILFERGKTS